MIEIRDIIALSQVCGIGTTKLRTLVDTFGSAGDVFSMSLSDLKQADLMPGVAEEIVSRRDEAYARADKELEFISKHNIRVLTCLDSAYPRRMVNDPYSPVALYMKGNANLDSLHVLSIVGTRQPSVEGRTICADIVAELSRRHSNLLIVSGLAFGIDIAAHRAALQNDVPTVGVVAHGLDNIYPAQHRDTAALMVSNGGILTEYLTNTRPDTYNFVHRNRIIAGLADATLVVESGIKGGSLITAHDALEFGREVMAIPGAPGNEKSAGCNNLIKRGEAALVENADDIDELLHWTDERLSKKGSETTLFDNVESEEQKRIFNLLMSEGELSTNEIGMQTGLPVSQISTILLEMEFAGMVMSLPGNNYKLLR